MESFEDYPLIDIEEGLGRTMKNKKLYAKLLTSFVSKPIDEALLNALAAKDLDGALAAAHAIKGLAANLSLLRLRFYAADIEAKIKKDGLDSGVFSAEEIERAKQCAAETCDKAREVISELTAG